MTVRELKKLIEKCSDDDKVIICIEQQNKVYPVAYIGAEFAHFGYANDSLKLSARLEEGEYLKVNKDVYGQREADGKAFRREVSHG